MKVKDFAQTILPLLDKRGETLEADIRKTLKVSKQSLQYQIKKLASDKVIRKKKVGRYNTWVITKKGKNWLEKNFAQKAIGFRKILTNTRIENHQVMVLCHDVNFEYLEKKAKKTVLKGGGYYYIFKDNPFNRTLKFTNTKKLIIYLGTKEIQPTISDLNQFNTHLFRELYSIFHWLEWKRIAHIDPNTLEDNYVEVANRMDEKMDDVTQKQEKVTEHLGRQATGFFTEKKQEARAWIDHSPGETKPNIAEIETNDVSYERKLLLLPELMFSVAQRQVQTEENQLQFSKDLQLHLKVLKDIGKGIAEFRDAVKDMKSPRKGGVPKSRKSRHTDLKRWLK